uniref:Sugar transporter SWEET n=1 Tax=Syphacia muris TaxID=451379 RepID=A0A0N5AMC2_9BILA
MPSTYTDSIANEDDFNILKQLFGSDLSIGGLFNYYYGLYTSNILWSLFLTSTALHAIVLVASPLQAVLKWHRRKSSDSDTAIPYLCTTICSTLWLRYSIFIEDVKLVLLQLYALAMQAFILLNMFIYRTRKMHFLKSLAPVLSILLFLLIYTEKLSNDQGRILMGRLASTAQICGSLVCPFLVMKAIQRKAVDFIPFLPVMFTWVMEIHAVIYSVHIHDFYMLVSPSLSLSIFALKFVCSSSTSNALKNKFSRTFKILSK